MYSGYRCAPPLVKDAMLLDRVRVLTSSRRRARAKAAAIEAMRELVNLGVGRLTTSSGSQKAVDTLLRGETSLAEFPYGTLLTSVSFQLYPFCFNVV